MARDYKDEYKKFQSSTKSKKARVRRNRDRRKALREGHVHKGDNKELDHEKAYANGIARVTTRTANRRRGKPS